jgi:hypothetical protein
MPIHGGVTIQTLNMNFGTNMATLPFAGTTTYERAHSLRLQPVDNQPRHDFSVIARANAFY